jgi:chitodextrinase
LDCSTDEAVTGYNVYNNEVLVTDNPITTTSYTITALTSSTDYNFTVKAIGNDGDLSEASNRVTVTTKPTAATNLTASQTTSSSTFLLTFQQMKLLQGTMFITMRC